MTELMISILIAVSAILMGYFLMVGVNRMRVWAEVMKPYHMHAYDLKNDFIVKSFWRRHIAAKSFAQFLSDPTLRDQTFIDISFRAKSPDGVDEYNRYSMAQGNTRMARRLQRAYDDLRVGELIKKHGDCDRN